MVLPEYVNSAAQFDCAINGVPFLFGVIQGNPYTRKAADFRATQIASAKDPGEQSLTNWWYRAQRSFHYGAGIEFMDPGEDPQNSYRFADSAGVNVWTRGRVSLLPVANVVAAGAGKVVAVGYSIGGEDGALMAQSNTLTKVRASDSAAVAVTSGLTGALYDLDTDGGAWFAIGAGGIARGALPDGAGAIIYTTPMGSGSIIKLVKDRLVIGSGPSLWVVDPTPQPTPAALSTAFYTSHSAGFLWRAVCEGPQAIYVSGSAGDRSTIYAIALSSAAGVPTLEPPVPVAELPRGEIVTSMTSYLGSMIIVGTNRGARIGMIGNGGALSIGPKLMDADAIVYGACAYDDHVFIGGSNVAGKPGLYRAELSRTLTSTTGQGGTLLFPWAKDVAAEGQAFSLSNPVRSVFMLGQSGQVAYTIDNVGLVFAHATNLVPSGWLETGRVRFDMVESKVFQFGKVLSSTQAGRIKVEWRNEAGVWATSADVPVAGVSEINYEASDGTPRQHISQRFTLTQGSPTISPIMTGYQLRSLPSMVRQRLIQLPLLCAPVEHANGGRDVLRSSTARLAGLENLEQSSRVVIFQMFGTGEKRQVIVESVSYIQPVIPDTPKQRANPSGVLFVTLRTVD